MNHITNRQLESAGSLADSIIEICGNAEREIGTQRRQVQALCEQEFHAQTGQVDTAGSFNTLTKEQARSKARYYALVGCAE